MKGNAYSHEFKEQILKEVEETGNVTLVARNHGIPSTTIYTWVKSRKKPSDGIPSRGPKSSNFNSNNYSKEIEKENDQLKKLLGEKDLEIAILKDLLKKTNRL
ncbi:transposase [Oxobacter pfennigii]|uniref:Transposase n=1 Tax=Oxobacter pfennigii TaxID=36849 RepID=A0A0P8WKT9_9CLOT|nr:transposase [Oxobacter pfennigii]KPU42970.1 transposase [Oxobacter pfennigii]